MIKKTLLFFSVFIVCNFNTIKAQGNANKVALIDVLLKLESTFNVQFSFADHNIDGKFIIAPDYTKSLENSILHIEDFSQLEFIAIGRNTYAIKAGDSTLDLSVLQNLQEVIVKNYLTKGIELNDDATTTIIPKSSGILPGLIESDILQTIQALPGVQSVDERVSDLNIRGGTNDQNLILWEGVKMYQTGHFFGLISAFNPYLTESVTVAKNGTSTFYGDGISSVIDIRNSNNVTNKTSSGFGINLISTDAYGVIPLNKKLELQLSARRSTTDFWTTRTYDSYFKRVFQNTDLTDQEDAISSDDARFYFYDISGKLIYKLSEKDKVSMSVLNIINSLDFEEKAINTNNKSNSTLQQNSLAATINYSRQWDDRLTTEAQLYLSDYTLDATNFNITNNQRLTQENDVVDLGIKLQARYILNPNIDYLGGYQFSEISISNTEEVNIPDFKQFVREINRNHAIFNEIRFTSNSKSTIFKIGLRNNFFQKFTEFNVEPRISFNQKFLNDFRLEILGELKSQTSTQIIDLQNDFLGIEKRRWISANNSDIPITKSGQISTGIHYNKSKLLISAEAYFKEVTGISTRSQGFQNQFQFVNEIGKYNIKGIDFLINKKFRNISSWLSYSYSENKYTFDDLNNGNSFSNNIAIKHAITFANTISWSDFYIGLGLNWRTGKPFTKPLANTPISGNTIPYSKPNANALSDYFRLDMSTNYNFKLSKSIKATTGFSLWNITNTRNTLNRYYKLNDDDTIDEIENQSLGITPNVSFRIDF